MAKRVVIIPNSLCESIQGRYFLGQTNVLSFGDGRNAWGGLFNPIDSQVKLFVNIFTITNISGTDFLAEIWVNSQMPGKGTASNMVMPSNMTLSMIPRPVVELNFAQEIADVPNDGVNPFGRVIPAITTVVAEKDGRFIIPSGGSFAIFLVGQEISCLQARIAFGWWEEKARNMGRSRY